MRGAWVGTPSGRVAGEVAGVHQLQRHVAPDRIPADRIALGGWVPDVVLLDGSSDSRSNGPVVDVVAARHVCLRPVAVVDHPLTIANCCERLAQRSMIRVEVVRGAHRVDRGAHRDPLAQMRLGPRDRERLIDREVGDTDLIAREAERIQGGKKLVRPAS